MPITHETLDGAARMGIEGELTIYTVAERLLRCCPGSAPRRAWRSTCQKSRKSTAPACNYWR